MFESLKKKFSEASGKLTKKVEDEAKDENNIELIEENIDDAQKLVESSEDEKIEDILDEIDSYEDKDEEIESFEVSEEDDGNNKVSEDEDSKSSGLFSFLKRSKGKDSEYDKNDEEFEDGEDSNETDDENKIDSDESNLKEESENIVFEDEDSDETLDDEETNSSKHNFSLFHRNKNKKEEDNKESSEDEGENSEDEDSKKKKRGFFSFIKEKSISEKDVEDILFELELGLLEADVAIDVANTIVDSVKEDLIGQKIKRSSDVEEYTFDALKKAVSKIIDIDGKSMTEMIEEKKVQGEPLVVMFVGINGTGKTTTIGKLANFYMGKGYTPVIAASDTFRAGAIEQINYHAEKLGVKLIKHEKGSDPAAVAFDAVAHAKAQGKELVLIDTAGRMQTNTNLMDEMKKIRRVAKPDLVVFVGDALTGNDATEQASKFNDAIDIDGVILTKADADSKGGASLSIGYVIKKPILFLGMGQSYDDIQEYDPDWMLNQIFS